MLESAGSDHHPLQVVVLISGSGTNLQALIDAIPNFQNPAARISLVISNSKSAYGLQRARDARPPIPTEIFSLASFRKQNADLTDQAQLRAHYDRRLADLILRSGRPRLIVLAGFMHILGQNFFQAINDSAGPSIQIINLHPALPGQFDGTNAIQRAWEAGPEGRQEIDQTGVMVHEVIPEVDRGTPILIKTVELRKGESCEALEQRMHEVEHQLIVDATYEMLRRISSGSIHNS